MKKLGSMLLPLCCAGALLLPSCVSPDSAADGDDNSSADALDGQDLKLDMPLDDLMSEVTGRGDEAPRPNADGGAKEEAKAPVSGKGAATAALALRVRPAAVSVEKFQLTTAYPYAGGDLGWLGSAKAFVAPSTVAPDDDHLYWIMVKVISEKFSCFMNSKKTLGRRLLVGCSDGRKVLLERQRGAGFVQFRARQYDGEGYEVLVKQHRMVRVDGAAKLSL